MKGQRAGEKSNGSMAYRSPNGVIARSRFLVKISPAEMKFGRSEYIFDRFSSRSTATRWLLMTRTPLPRAPTYIIPPEKELHERGFCGHHWEVREISHRIRPCVAVTPTNHDLQCGENRQRWEGLLDPVGNYGKLSERVWQ